MFCERLLGALGSFCQEVLISSNEPAPFSRFPHRIIPDLDPGQGPLGGLESLFKAGRFPWLLVLSCDMPLVDSAARQLLLEKREWPARLICFAESSRHHPFPGLYHADLQADLSHALETGNRSVRDFISRLPKEWKKIVSLEECEAKIKKEFVNVNSRSDLFLLEAN